MRQIIVRLQWVAKRLLLWRCSGAVTKPVFRIDLSQHHFLPTRKAATALRLSSAAPSIHTAADGEAIVNS
jgi:hypothetical protein